MTVKIVSVNRIPTSVNVSVQINLFNGVSRKEATN
jgi:hypothetical protein